MASSLKEKKAMMLMLLCASLWSIGGLLIKLVPWNALAIAGTRSLIAAGVIFLYMRISKTPFCINRASLLGGVMVAGTFVCFVSANKLTTAANAIVLQYTAPVFLLLYDALIRKKRCRRPDLITVILTLLGIALAFLDQLSMGNILGNCLALSAGIFFAGMYIVTGSTSNEARMSGILIGHLLTALIGVPLLFTTHAPITFPAILGILLLGVVQLGIPYVLYGVAVRHTPPLACCLLGAVEPLLNPIWVFLFDGERPGTMAIAGGLIVICAITVWCIWQNRYAKPMEI